ncbi:MAG: FHA domain-containing protein, partial [Prolixibacteraceae bacterium]|nr:FHA domain-containing protein [Prolixibacteraceae bacterium]
MAAKIILKISKGSLSGKEFSYSQKESIILGRNKDCHVEFPELTVSRYHCLLDIVPPAVMVRDFGSKNGTFLNGEKIGERAKHLSAEDGREQKYNEFPMKSGDRLGLGHDCEIILYIVLPQYCSECFDELEEFEHHAVDGTPVCDVCHAKGVERRKREEAEKMAAQ